MRKILTDELEIGSPDELPPVTVDKRKLPDSQSELESLNDQQLLELSSLLGSKYQTFIQKLIGQSAEEVDFSDLPELLKIQFQQLTQTIKKNSDIQHQRMEIAPKDAIGMLLQAFPAEAVDSFTDEEKAQIQLKELSHGFFSVTLPHELYHRLYGSARAQAVAISIREGISFIMLQSGYADQKRYLEENVPHESHHIAWNHCKKEGIIPSDEADPNVRKAFISYQDELIATICSNAYIGGHPQLSSADRSKLVAENKTALLEINQRVGDLQEIAEALNDSIKAAGLQSRDLLLPVITAKNFSQLRANLKKFTAILEARSLPKASTPPLNNGWGSIG